MLRAYVLIKILKFCTGSSAKSYQCKVLIGRVLTNRYVTFGELGKIIKEVIHHYTLRGKFSSVHPELRQEGIIRVEVEDEGLRFVRAYEDQDEEEMLRKALALSLEETEEDDEEDEEELLRQAIALSLAYEV